MLLALATNDSSSPRGFALIRNKTKRLLRQQLCTQHTQQGRARSWERSPPGRGRRREDWQTEVPGPSSSPRHRLRGPFWKKRWESVLSKGHKKGRGNKICVYIPGVFLGGLVTNPTTRPPQKKIMHVYPHSIKLKTWTGLHLCLHLFLCISIKKKNQQTNYSLCEILPWWFGNKTQTTTKRKETKFLTLCLSLSVASSRDLKTQENTL